MSMGDEIKALQMETQERLQAILDRYKEEDGTCYTPYVQIHAKCDLYKGVPAHRMHNLYRHITGGGLFGFFEAEHTWLKPLLDIDPTLEHWDVGSYHNLQAKVHLIAYEVKDTLHTAEIEYLGHKWAHWPSRAKKRFLIHDGSITL